MKEQILTQGGDMSRETMLAYLVRREAEIAELNGELADLALQAYKTIPPALHQLRDQFLSAPYEFIQHIKKWVILGHELKDGSAGLPIIELKSNEEAQKRGFQSVATLHELVKQLKEIWEPDWFKVQIFHAEVAGHERLTVKLFWLT